MNVKFKNALWQYQFMEKLLTHSLQKNRMEKLMKIRNNSGKQPKVFRLDDVESGQLVTLINNEHNKSVLGDWSIKSVLDESKYIANSNIFFTTATWDNDTRSIMKLDDGCIYDVPRDVQVYVYDEPEILISNFKTEEDE